MLKLRTAAGARKGQAGPAERIERGTVAFGAVRLAHHGAVPLKAKCFQGAQDAVGCARDLARAVQILHAQQPAAAACPRFQIAGGSRKQ